MALPDFVKGASGPTEVYDVSAAGLGLSPAYLASTSASASSANSSSGTIFPTSPSDGDIFIYTADAANGVKWQFQYDSSQATYKWVCVGGSPLITTIATSESTTSAGYTDLASVGPSVIVPLAGDYDILMFAMITENDASAGAAQFISRVSPSIGGAAAVDADSMWHQTLAAGGSPQRDSTTRPLRKTALAASATIKLQYKTNSGTGRFEDRYLAVRPVRVSG